MLYGIRSLVDRLGLWGMEGEAGITTIRLPRRAIQHNLILTLTPELRKDAVCRLQVGLTSRGAPKINPEATPCIALEEIFMTARKRMQRSDSGIGRNPRRLAPHSLSHTAGCPFAFPSSLLRLFSSSFPLLTPVMSATFLYVILIQPSPLAARYPPSPWRGRTEDLALVRETPITPLLTRRGGEGIRDPEVLRERALPSLPPASLIAN